jgi:hypothetical protein
VAEFTVGSLVMDGSDSTNQGGMYPHKSFGSRPFSHDLMTLHNLWIAPTQMLQLAPDHAWCSCCGDVRPKTYFDPVAWDDDGKATKWANECKMCSNARDPKLRAAKYCSACRQEKPCRDFGIDLRNVDELQSYCKECEAKRSRARYRERVGREVRTYTYRT